MMDGEIMLLLTILEMQVERQNVIVVDVEGRKTNPHVDGTMNVDTAKMEVYINLIVVLLEMLVVGDITMARWCCVFCWLIGTGV
jgi:hypothetical protein